MKKTVKGVEKGEKACYNRGRSDAPNFDGEAHTKGNFMEFQKLAAERYSVRKFKPAHLPKKTLDKILQIGHMAPTGCNYQPYRVLVINTDESCARLASWTKCHFDAPTALLVCYHKEECWHRRYDGAPSGPVDAAIVGTHLMLAAADLGVGCTWVMHFDPAAMRAAFAIPEQIEPVALLVMGIPDNGVEPFHLHGEFRPLSEVVLYDSFSAD